MSDLKKIIPISQKIYLKNMKFSTLLCGKFLNNTERNDTDD